MELELARQNHPAQVDNIFSKSQIVNISGLQATCGLWDSYSVDIV